MGEESIYGRHNCKAMLLGCKDFRFPKDLIRHMEDLGFESDFDPVLLAGGAKNLSSPSKPCRFETVLDEIESSIKLHEIDVVILSTHTKCGAVDKKFENIGMEIEFHKAELDKAAEVVAEKFPSLKIIKIFAYYEGEKGNEKPKYMVL